mgnify:CR=1 FL=1
MDRAPTKWGFRSLLESAMRRRQAAHNPKKEKGGNMRTQVFSIRTRHDGGGVFIGRPSKWGNPFAIGRGDDRAAVIQKFREWVFAPERTVLRAEARCELRGQDLYCYCAPLPCHGDVWAQIADSESDEELHSAYCYENALEAYEDALKAAENGRGGCEERERDFDALLIKLCFCAPLPGPCPPLTAQEEAVWKQIMDSDDDQELLIK